MTQYALIGSFDAGSGGTTPVASLGVSVTYGAGEHVFLMTSSQTAPSSPTLTDTIGNQYSLVPGVNNPLTTSTPGDTLYLWECISTIAGSGTATYALGGATTSLYLGIDGVRFSGLPYASLCAGLAQVGAGAQKDSIATPTLQPAAYPGAVIGFAYDFNGTTLSAGSGFSSSSTFPTEGAANGAGGLSVNARVQSLSNVRAGYSTTTPGDPFALFTIYSAELRPATNKRTRKSRRRVSQTFDYAGAGWFDVSMARGALFDREMVVAGTAAVSTSSATTDGADVLAASVGPIVAASLASTDGADVLAGLAAAVVGATSATTDGADVLTANVSNSLAALSASSATTDGADVLASNVAPIVAASSATTDGADVLAASVGPVVAATLAKTDGADVLAGTASVIVGTASATTDGADVLASAVAPVVGVTSATTDGADVLSASVANTIGVSASSATTDGADVLAAAVGPVVSASTAKTDGADVLAAAVSPVLGAAAAWADGVDALSAAVGPVVSASSGLADGADVLAATASPIVGLSGATADGADLLAAAASPASPFVLGNDEAWFVEPRAQTAYLDRMNRVDAALPLVRWASVNTTNRVGLVDRMARSAYVEEH